MSEIPKAHIVFCKKLTELAKEHGVVQFNGEFRVSCVVKDYEPWPHFIKFNWFKGRHGEPSPLSIESVQHCSIEV